MEGWKNESSNWWAASNRLWNHKKGKDKDFWDYEHFNHEEDPEEDEYEVKSYEYEYEYEYTVYTVKNYYRAYQNEIKMCNFLRYFTVLVR